MCQTSPGLSIKQAIIIVLLVTLALVIVTFAAHGSFLGITAILGKDNPEDYPFELFRMLNLLFVAIANSVVIAVLCKRFDTNLKGQLLKVQAPLLLLFFGLTFFIFILVTPLVNPLNFFRKLFDGMLLVHKLNFDSITSFNFSVNSYFLLMVFVGPVLEEIIYRGILFFLLLKRYSLLTAMLVSSFLFAFMHLRFMGILYLFVYGLLFSFAYYRTRSLLTPIVLHIFINLMANLTRNQQVDLSSANGTKYFLFFAVSIASLVFLFSFINKGENALTVGSLKLKNGKETSLKGEECLK